MLLSYCFCAFCVVTAAVSSSAFLSATCDLDARDDDRRRFGGGTVATSPATTTGAGAGMYTGVPFPMIGLPLSGVGCPDPWYCGVPSPNHEPTRSAPLERLPLAASIGTDLVL
jgi:hypothetical protein